MTDRNVFVTSFLTAVLIVAGAFALHQLFFFELAKSAIFVAVAVMVFYGDNKYSYMLGVVAPIVWFVVELIPGSFVSDFRVLFRYMSPSNALGPLETPLHALSYLAALALIFVSWRAWHKEVPEKFAGKPFWTCLGISAAYYVVLAVWYTQAVHG